MTIRHLVLRLRALLRPRQVERELRDELAFHIERETHKLIAEGVARDEAVAKARARFGPAPLVADRCRDQRGLGVIDATVRDARLALRRLSRAPMFALFSIVTLAAGIGVTTAFYASIQAFVWRDAGVRSPGELVTVQTEGQRLSFSELEILQEPSGVFASVAAYAAVWTSLSAGGDAELARCLAVSGGWFDTLGVKAARGRVIQPSDDRPGAPLVVVLSDRVWRTRFAEDPGIIGRPVRMAGQVFEVIGVAPRTFAGLDIRTPAAAWVPMASAGLFGRASARDVLRLTPIARLSPSTSMASASQVLATVAARLDALGLQDNRDLPRVTHAGAWRLAPAVFRPQIDASVGALLIVAMPALVLLVACTNLANLVLSRGVARRHEYAIRVALGASRGSLVRAYLLEHLTIALAGTIAGLAVARALLVGMQVFASRYVMADSLPEPRFDLRVIGASVICGTIALCVTGLVPGLHLTRRRARVGLAANDHEGGLLPRWRGRRSLIAWQVAVSVALFMIMAISLRLPYVGHRAGDLDLDPVAIGVIPFEQQQRASSAEATTQKILTQLQGSRGVSSVAWASGIQGSGGWSAWADLPDGGGAYVEYVSPHALRVLGVPLTAGREFDAQDGASSTDIVISESLARKLFGSANAIGLPVRARVYGVRSVPTLRASVPLLTFSVVGVAADTVFDGLGQPRPVIYRAFAAGGTWEEVAIVARSTTVNQAALVTAVRTAIRRAAPDLALAKVAPASSVLQPEAELNGALVWVCGGLALMALVLCMTGLYGVLSHVVTCRTRELGLRMALGARRADVVKLIVRDGARPVLKGLSIALLVATAVRLLIQTRETVNLSPFDPRALTIAVVPVALAAALACYLPARRAARLEPNEALREL